MNARAELRAAHFYPDAGLPGWRVDAWNSWALERGDLSLVVSEETTPDGIRVWSWLACRIVDGEAHQLAHGVAPWPRAAMRAATGSTVPGTGDLYQRFVAGDTIKVLALAAGLLPQTLYCRMQRWAERQGELWPVRRAHRRTPHDPTRAPRAIQLRRQGLRWQVIADRVGYGCNRSAQRSVRDYCTRHRLEYPR